MKKLDYIFFDLDGTLIDTIPLILESFKHTFIHHFGHSRPQEETIRYIGMPLKEHFRDIYPGHEEELVKTYRAYNESRHDRHIGLFIGIFKLLEKLEDMGFVLGVVTSKRRELAIRGLKLFDIYDFFDIVIGAEDTERHKPFGDPLLKAMQMVGATDKSRVLYIGDSPLDILCAKDAGTISAGVAWTYSSPYDLQKEKPNIFLNTPMDLIKYIQKAY